MFGDRSVKDVDGRSGGGTWNERNAGAVSCTARGRRIGFPVWSDGLDQGFGVVITYLQNSKKL